MYYTVTSTSSTVRPRLPFGDGVCIHNNQDERPAYRRGFTGISLTFTYPKLAFASIIQIQLAHPHRRWWVLFLYAAASKLALLTISLSPERHTKHHNLGFGGICRRFRDCYGCAAHSSRLQFHRHEYTAVPWQQWTYGAN